jgi:hypothetical protein
MDGHHRCRIHALVPTKIIETTPSPGEQDLLRGATPVEVTRSGSCGHIAKTWQLVKVDLREPEEVEFELTPKRGLVSTVLLIGLGLVVFGSWFARGPGRSAYRGLKRRLNRWIDGDSAIPEARIHEDRERDT